MPRRACCCSRCGLIAIALSNQALQEIGKCSHHAGPAKALGLTALCLYACVLMFAPYAGMQLVTCVLLIAHLACMQDKQRKSPSGEGNVDGQWTRFVFNKVMSAVDVAMSLFSSALA